MADPGSLQPRRFYVLDRENLLKYQGDLDLWFPPTSTRYLHILQTGRAEAYYWSVHEIKLYEFQIQGRIRAGY